AFNGNWVLRACVASNSTLPTYPGTAADLTLRTSVGGAPLDAADVKSATGGDFLTFEMHSPGGGLAGRGYFLVVEVFATGSPPVSPYPGIAVSGNPALTFLAVGAGASPFGPTVFGPAPTSFAFQVPQGFSGASGLFQVLVSWTGSANGIFESSDGREIQLL
ncbi:MAG: hypothetical protein KDB53_12255, partial [Planctomycetes bacterium]|nr:hypothetical protein [Planctomycetota bacterium]